MSIHNSGGTCDTVQRRSLESAISVRRVAVIVTVFHSDKPKSDTWCNIYMFKISVSIITFFVLIFNKYYLKKQMSFSKHISIFKNCLFSLSWWKGRQLNISLFIMNNLNLRLSIFCWKSSCYRKFISFLIYVHATSKKKMNFPIIQLSQERANKFFSRNPNEGMIKPLHS